MKELPLLDHLGELRKRLIFLIVIFILFFVIGVGISNLLIDKIQRDLVVSKVIIAALSPLEYFYTQMKIGLIIAIILSFPFLLYHIIHFIHPALTKKELHALILIIPAIVLLFIIGILFCYYAFLKLAIIFFANLATQGNVINLWSISEFFNFVLYSCLGFGLVFELPLLLFVLYKLNIISKEFLRRQRRYVYVAICILAAVITPQTDAVSMLIMALVLVVLYELSVLFIRIFG